MTEETLAPMSECLFAMGDDDGEVYFLVCRTAFWKENGFIEDQNVVDMPEGFYDLMEATWEFDGDPAEGRRILEAAGATYSNEIEQLTF